MTYLAPHTPPLVQWLSQQPIPPGTTLYTERLTRVFEYLQKHVYPHIGAGDILQTVTQNDVQGEYRQIGYLTDHGEQHIRTVIARASDLAFNGTTARLSPYETYLLIQAIHLHDVGNIYGRTEHEKKLAEVMRALGPLLAARGTKAILAGGGLRGVGVELEVGCAA